MGMWKTYSDKEWVRWHLYDSFYEWEENNWDKTETLEWRECVRQCFTFDDTVFVQSPCMYNVAGILHEVHYQVEPAIT